ncbi:GNAT family N-acetyltransferase [Demequina pelophila]|uniref:GNAT family N-acetyltransferase n=1 Tax=Demequina pelophila TaxID=1638984 RepID=UPI00078435CA|nr:GNAT family N-acetyltransferase [Demequina pelophila]
MIRPAAPADHAAIARICLLTGDRGADATGVHGDDALLADVYALPYLAGPGGFALVWERGGEALGYVLGTSDTAAFQGWFVADWWPRIGPGHVARNTAGRELIAQAADPGRTLIPQLADYPAHLHIDLLPEAQGRGAGRALIEAACALLGERGVPGVHLVAERANAGAQAFYPRVGFRAVGWDDATVTFARRLA